MRDVISPFLTAIGILCIYLFACGITVSEGGDFHLLADRASAPFHALTPFSTAMLGTAILALTLALVLPRDFAAPGSRWSWGRVLQVALILDVALVAAVLTLLILPETGRFPRFSPSAAAVGALYLAAILEAALGTCLVIALFFFEKSRRLFTTTVVAHAAEIGLLGWIFFLGSRA